MPKTETQKKAKAAKEKAEPEKARRGPPPSDRRQINWYISAAVVEAVEAAAALDGRSPSRWVERHLQAALETGP